GGDAGEGPGAPNNAQRRMQIVSIVQREPEPVDRVRIREVKARIAVNEERIAAYEKECLDLQLCDLCRDRPRRCRSPREHATGAFERQRKTRDTKALISQLNRENRNLNGQIRNM